jgi:hypothetical protein
VAQQQDLDLLLSLRTTPKHQQLEQPAHRPVRQREDHAPRTRHRIDPIHHPTHRHTAITQNRGIRVIGTYRPAWLSLPSKASCRAGWRRSAFGRRGPRRERYRPGQARRARSSPPRWGATTCWRSSLVTIISSKRPSRRRPQRPVRAHDFHPTRFLARCRHDPQTRAFGVSPMLATEDGAFMEPRGCNRWQPLTNNAGAKTPESSYNRCCRLMVRRRSTVRVRKRALQKPRVPGFSGGQIGFLVVEYAVGLEPLYRAFRKKRPAFAGLSFLSFAVRPTRRGKTAESRSG